MPSMLINKESRWAQSPKSSKKQSGGVYFDNMALYFDKNALFQTAFLAILPSGV